MKNSGWRYHKSMTSTKFQQEKLIFCWLDVIRYLNDTQLKDKIFIFPLFFLYHIWLVDPQLTFLPYYENMFMSCIYVVNIY